MFAFIKYSRQTATNHLRWHAQLAWIILISTVTMVSLDGSPSLANGIGPTVGTASGFHATMRPHGTVSPQTVVNADSDRGGNRNVSGDEIAPHLISSAAAFAHGLPPDWRATPPVQFKQALPHVFNPMTTNASLPYMPASVRGAYGLNALGLSNTTGAGVTVAIVDAYGDTSASLSDLIQSDLQQFCSATGLPYSGPGSGTPTLTEAFPSGMPTANDSNWAIETALDVEWVHAMAPGAKILLVVSPDSSDSLYTAVQYAASHASIVTMSWGGPEFNTETSYDSQYFSVPNVAFFASSGDWGSGTFYPSVSANVISVGGTSLTIDSSGNWVSETGWSGSGGGVSTYEPAAAFQSSWVSSGNREMPDIAAVADPNTGVYVVQGGGTYQVGGTSLSSPLWAGFTAILDGNLSQPIGSAALHSMLYTYGNATNINTNFHDILSGSNGAYTAASGYDLVTGIGSPKVNVLLQSIVNSPAPPAPVITSSTSVSGNQYTSLSYSIVATNTPTSFNAIGLPAGLSVNSSTGVIIGTPTDQGTFNVSLSATNSGGTGTATLTMTIGAPLPPPVITSATTVTITANSYFSYQITATNSPTSYYELGEPSGIYVNSSGQIYGFAGAAGIYHLTIGASNYSGSGSAQLTLTVNPAVPYIVGAASATAVVGQPFSYQITALNSPTSYNAVSLPAGLSINTSTGVISGTPASTGVSTATVSATNITGSSSRNLTITTISATPSALLVTNTNDSGAGSLRAAITAANTTPGATIQFQSGLSGTITLASSLPPILVDTTIQGPGASQLAIDGAGAYRILQLGDGAGDGANTSSALDGGTVTISGLTIQHGSDQADTRGGAGILVTSNASLVLTNCSVLNCTSTWYGAGIGSAGIASISNCTFAGNSGKYGAAAANIGNMTLTGCSIMNNTASWTGGSVEDDASNVSGAARNGELTMTNCSVTGNTVPSNGATGNVMVYGIANITGCTITGNSAPYGAGFHSGGTTTVTNCTLTQNASIGCADVEEGWATLSGCTISGNTGADGGAVYATWGTASLTNCTISGNMVGYEGSAVLLNLYSTVTLTGCTVTGNTNTTADSWAAAIDAEATLSGTTYPVAVNLTNDILYGNSALQAGTNEVDQEIFQNTGATVTSSYCDIFGGLTGIGNINANPMLSALGNFGGPTQTIALLPGSPCLGAGTSANIPRDQRGTPRPQGGRYDIGAFESRGFVVMPNGGQVAAINTAFANPLSVLVAPKFALEPIVGGVIDFSAPVSGASAVLSAASASIGADGTASLTATANGVGGNYQVTADSLAGAGTFSLTNVSSAPPAPTGLAAALHN